MRLALEELGPTFIKLGQLLSTRPDLLSEEYIAELEHLQDNVAAEDAGKIKREMELELGRPTEQVFRQFDMAPIAAGSIAQVHRAVTPAGDVVAVKIRRPGVVQRIKAECGILENLAGVVGSVLSEEETDRPGAAGAGVHIGDDEGGGTWPTSCGTCSDSSETSGMTHPCISRGRAPR